MMGQLRIDWLCGCGSKETSYQEIGDNEHYEKAYVYCSECGQEHEHQSGNDTMTEQQIISALATKVMGWHKSEFNGAERWYKECGNPAERINWNPLQNIADAWQVYMKLIEKHEDATLTFPWCIVADWGSDEGWRIRGEGDTAQEAICKAAMEMIA